MLLRHDVKKSQAQKVQRGDGHNDRPKKGLIAEEEAARDSTPCSPTYILLPLHGFISFFNFMSHFLPNAACDKFSRREKAAKSVLAERLLLCS